MATQIDATACVDSKAHLEDDVEVGPYCVVGPDVIIGRGTRLVGHVSVTGNTTIGEQNVIGRFCALGCAPQDASYRDTPTRLILGDRNELRGHVTISRGSEKEDGVTRVGDDNRFEIGSHVAHDCRLADGISMGSGVLLAGHVRLQSNVTLDDGSVVLQFVTVGEYSHATAMAKVGRYLPPFMIAVGNPAEVRHLNAAALKRHELGLVDAAALRVAYRLIFREKVELTKAETALVELDQLTPLVVRLLDFLKAQRKGRLGRARGR